MQLSNNNMEIRSIQFHVPFPPDCFFFQEFFFMGGAIHPFPKIMRGEIAFFLGGGGAIHPFPKIMREVAGSRPLPARSYVFFGESVTAMSKREDRDVRASSLFSLLAICT